jgi:hypothetical protein
MSANPTDLLSENLIDLPTACKHPALRNTRTSKPCHVAQLYRYIQRGARAANGSRVRLESVVTPGGRRTSTQAINRFIHQLTNPTLPPPTTKQRQRQQAAAEAELAAAGFDVGG